MKHYFKILCACLFTGSTFAQNIDVNQFTTPTNTGANMTLGINTDDLDDFIGATIGAFNSEGNCVGSEIIQDEFFSMAIWGNDTGTPELDGLLDNDVPVFAILTENGLVISIAEIANYSGYVTNALVVSTEFSFAGCTSSEYLEFHTQGYTADVDNGSCESPTYSLDITSSMFTTVYNTGSNMNIGMNTPIINLFEDGIIGAFNSAGICVGLETIQDGFFTMSLWGDDTSTDEIDGLLENEMPTFAILTTSDYVLAFESVPEFGGYLTNSFPTFTEINFDLTIYGCMDASYCYFNPDAEEDDGSCEGLPGCIDDHFVEFNADASCELEGACATTWIAAHEQLSADFTDLSADYDYQINTVQEGLTATIFANEVQISILTTDYASMVTDYEGQISILTTDYASMVTDYEGQISILTADYESMVTDYEGQISILTADFETMEADYMAQISNLEDSIANYSSPIAIDIVEGWNIIGFTLDEPQDAVATFDGIVEHISIVKNNNAEVYWPAFGFNGIGDLIPGQGYQIKVTQAIDGFMYPDTNGQRIELSPTVPQWAIDMPAESHPNDTRTIVKIINLLGQEINVEDASKGSTLIYLYSDGSVEKKLN